MKKSAKVVSLLIMAVMLMAALAACGGGNAASSNSGNSGNSDSAASAASAASTEASVAGETFDMGTFTVLVPDGWVAQDYKDMDQVKLYKADSLDNTFFAPEIDITYKADTAYELFTSIFESYEEIAPITIGEYTWNGVQGVYSSTKDCLSLNTTVGDGYIATDVWVKVGDSSISVDDADVNAILSSITIK